MKKIILVLILVSGAGVGTYYWKSGENKADEPEIVLGKVERGSIKQIVATTGKVVSNLDVDIKCKASGTVSSLPFDVSDAVGVGDVVCKIDTRDMQRVKDQSTVTLNSAKAKLANATYNLAIAERTLKTDSERARANLLSAMAAAKDARAKADRLKELFEKKLASQEELDTAETAATQAQSSLASCQIKMEELKTQEKALDVQRENVKLAEGEVSADQIALDIATDAFNDCTVKAPDCATTQPAGEYIPPRWVVSARTVQTGMIIASAVSNVGGGTTIMTLSDMSRIFVLASVDESDIGKIQVGQPATITVDAYPSTQFIGRVVRIASKGVNTQNVVTFEVKIEVLGAAKPRILASRPEAGGNRAEESGKPQMKGSAAAGTQQTKAGQGGKEGRRPKPSTRPALESPSKLLARGDLIPEKKNLLKPEMTANIEIMTAERENALLVPSEAVSRQAGLMYASVPGATEDEPDRKPIEVGILSNDGLKYELLAGLNEGDTVVIHRGESDSRWANNGQRRPGGSANTMRAMRMGRGGH